MLATTETGLTEQPPTIAFPEGPQIPIALIFQELSPHSQQEIQAIYWKLAYKLGNNDSENLD
jgi:hypothetical protein